MSKLSVTQVIQDRIHYAREQAEARRKSAIATGERAAAYAARGEYNHARDAAETAARLELEAEMWAHCANELLQPIALYLEAQ